MSSASTAEIVSERLPKIDFGRGCYVTDTDGREYLDGSGSPAVFSLGYAHPEVNAAIETQLARAAHGYRYTFTSDPLERLTELIRAQAGPGFEHMVFVSSGSEAMESALKIALQYHWSVGEPQRTRFISRRRSYHGNTLGALSVSGFSQRRRQFEGSLLPVTFVSAANTYRPPEGVGDAELVDFLADELEQAILEQGADRVAAFVMEPVVGAAGGVVPAPPGYAQRVREVCDRHGVLLIADEVMCGAGRCGTWRALEHDSVHPDIMTLAKGLGGGFVPLGAAVFSARVGAPIYETSGGPNTGHTATGHTLACAAAVAVQEIVIRDRLVDRVRTAGAEFLATLRKRVGSIDAVGDVRGRGFFVGVELVADRGTREPFAPELRLHDRIRQRCMEAGLICYPVGGNVDGARGDVAILAPPYIATDDELEEIIRRFVAGLERALADIGRS
jgi:adenosylmethionine-8-amino-7-oxononanoate aminotransferase